MNKNTSFNMYRDVIKRILDFAFALFLLILLFPVLLIVSILLFFANNGSIFFFQKRIGKDEQPFRICKFKSMNDKRDQNNELLSNEERLTSIGRFIRKTSIDELPQLFNVLSGQMSFVGPRPLHIRYLPYYTPQEAIRHWVRPGITGLAQVNGRNDIGWDERLQLDAAYVQNMSFGEDLGILLKTALKVFRTSEIKSEGIEALDEYRDRINFKNNLV